MTAPERSRYGRYGECACCGTEGPLTGRGLVPRCEYWYRTTGQLGEWPTDRELVEEDVRMVLATGVEYAVVAARCGITKRTVCRIVARWKLTSVPGTGVVPEVVQGPVQAVREAAA